MTATRTDGQPPALHVAGSHALIRVHDARANNLKDVSIEIPKRRLTVFTGVSGRIVFEGTPAELVPAPSTLTGEHLAAYLGT
jgi:excinuclease UvrABC ATPase subunit